MAEALLSVILDQLTSITRQQTGGWAKLVMGVDDEIQGLTFLIRTIKDVVDDAENKEVKDDDVRDWLDKLKEVAYDIDDVLDEWNTSIGKIRIKEAENAMMGKVCSLIPCHHFSCRQFILRHDIASKIKDLDKALDVIATEKNRFGFSLTEGLVEPKRPMTASFVDVSMVHGRENDKDTLLAKLLHETESSEAPTIAIISIVGMGGIGKTTLAQLVFNDDKVKTHFDERIWVCVSKPFNEIRIAKAILKSLGRDASKLVQLKTVLQFISQSLERKKYFLVLDDVWTANPKDWEQLINCLKCGSRGSRILATTRKREVANIIATGTTNVVSLETLTEDDSWSLFRQVALFERESEVREKLEEIGRKVVGKCTGLPLAIKTIASLLRFKTTIREWQSVLDSEMWELKKVEEGLFSPLLLCYYDLPFSLRRCFSFCATFQKDHWIEKDKLINLWMAQNYLKEEQNKDMELIGEEYFNNLAMRSFFQEFEKNKVDGSIVRCKMNNIVHDFAQFLCKNECFNIKIEDFEKSQMKLSSRRARHLEVELGDDESHFECLYNQKSLRSLVVSDISLSSATLYRLFCNFTCLRRLDLRSLHIKEVPKEIEELIHLRYLDLSNNFELKMLPKSLCNLYNLQTLNLTGCTALIKLPQKMGKLISLRHLIIEWTWRLSFIPKGIEGLTSLRTLSDLKLRSRNIQGGKSCGIECLENLNNLGGSLNIWGLKHVADVGNVKKANLKNKRNLRSLFLDFQDSAYEERFTVGNDERVLEALEPPSNIEKLFIFDYQAKGRWPQWMASLSQLRELVLDDCRECEYLPPLGKLSSLESLWISRKESVRRVGNEFLGIESNDTATSTILFPKLKTLLFDDMKEWEEWDIRRRGDEHITIMPCLHTLGFKFCPKLRALPNSMLQRPTLKCLNIFKCSILQARYKKETGEDWAKISHIPNISSLPNFSCYTLTEFDEKM